jgi:cobalt-zinc-cadmium efflux system outer membrane protein
MRRHVWRALVCFAAVGLSVHSATAQHALSWSEVRERFERNNQQLLASRLTIEEARANEVTAGLRPNPQFNGVFDQFHILNPNPLQPFGNSQLTPSVSQLFERQHKRDLRVESSRFATAGAASDQADLERNLLFSLRDAFVRTLQAKSLLELAAENLQYYDKVIEVNRQRLAAGDISRSDFVRVDLQRVQFASDLINARVNVRTAKIQLLALLNDRQPVDGFDVTGAFAFQETVTPLSELRSTALQARPDFESARHAVEKAKADARLARVNGSADPTFGIEYQRTGPDNTLGFIFDIPIRIFDRNQGEKARTEIEIHRAERLQQNAETNILRDVDSAYATLQSVAELLRPYRDKYLQEASEVRDLVSFAYQNGAASLLDFLDAQKSYRDTQLSYRTLVGSYLSSVNQLNLAVGREVIQ